MTNKSIRSLLLSRLVITKQALSLRAKSLKEKFGPMTTEEAVYVIAHMEGIDLSRHLPLDQLDRVRSLVPKPSPQANVPHARQKARTTKKHVQSYPKVSVGLISQAALIGSESFPEVFVLENSIRNYIESVLVKVRADWWPALIDPAVVNSVARTKKKESYYPYRDLRGAKDILYCNFADLKRIVEHQYPYFQAVIVDLNWFKVKMDEVYMARNNIAHSVSLSKDDKSRISLFYRDWDRLLTKAGVK